MGNRRKSHTTPSMPLLFNKMSTMFNTPIVYPCFLFCIYQRATHCTTYAGARDGKEKEEGITTLTPTYCGTQRGKNHPLGIWWVELGGEITFVVVRWNCIPNLIIRTGNGSNQSFQFRGRRMTVWPGGSQVVGGMTNWCKAVCWANLFSMEGIVDYFSVGIGSESIL